MNWSWIPVDKGLALKALIAQLNQKLSLLAGVVNEKQRQLVVDVRDFGVFGRGTVDEQSDIAKALIQGAGNKIVFPKPLVRYVIGSGLTIPALTEIEGMGVGGVEIQVPAGSTFRVFDFDGVTNSRIAGFKVTVETGDDTSGLAHGVDVRGACSDIVVERVTVDGFVRGMNISGSDGTVSGTPERITVRTCRAINSPSQYGFNVDECDGLLFFDCHASNSWLDGFKLRRMTQNVHLSHCSGKSNGQVRVETGTSTGEGIDTYAGGNTFVLDHFIAEDNFGNGITVKTDLLSASDPDTYGYVRNIQIINPTCRRNDVGTPGATGLGVYTGADGSDLTLPVSADVTIHGGIYEDNNGYGIVTNCRNATIHGPVCKRNTTKNIWVRDRSFDVEIFGPKCLAAGYGTLASGTNLQIDGKYVKVWGGTYLGVDADDVKVESDLAALPVYTSTNILVSATADEVEIHDPTSRYYTTTNANGIGVSAGATGKIIINQRLAANPTGSTGARGGIGSRVINTAAAVPEDVLWIKTTGTPDAASTGWARASELRSVSADKGNASVNLSVSSERTQRWNTPLTVLRTCKAPSASIHKGMRFRVVRQAGATGAFNLDVQNHDATVLKSLTAAGQWCEIDCDGTNWFLSANGSL